MKVHAKAEAIITWIIIMITNIVPQVLKIIFELRIFKRTGYFIYCLYFFLCYAFDKLRIRRIVVIGTLLAFKATHMFRSSFPEG